MEPTNTQELILKNLLKVIFCITVFAFFTYILSPFFIPVLIGGILAMAFSPFVGIFMNKGFSRKASLRLLSLILFFVGIVPVGIFVLRGAKIIREMVSAPSSLLSPKVLSTKLDGVISKFSKIYGISRETLHGQIDQLTEKFSSFIFNSFGNLIGQIPDLALISIITLLSFYFFLTQEEKIRGLFDQYFFFENENGEKFVQMLKSSCREVFFLNILTGVIQSMIISIGALIAGIGDFFLIFFATFVFSFVPVIGAGPVGFLLAIYAFMINDVYAALVMLFIALVASVSDNIIRPFLNSLGSVEVPPFVGFLAVIGGVIILGLPGIFVAPLLASICFGLVPIMYDEYLVTKNMVEEEK